MLEGEEVSQDTLGVSLRELRPPGPAASSLEQRLAIAAILAQAGSEASRPQLGRLAIQRRIGGGGMGVVYRAFDPDLGRLVAVKLLRGSVEREERTLIAAEARALAQVSHPNVVTVHEIVDRNDDLYFVMEFVPGVTLRGWLDDHPTASWREVVEWFVQAGRGLAAAHAKGVVHRDFKPENVLVGDDRRVRVADFGLALHELPGVETEGPAAAGTLHYMAPEVRGGGAGTAASDQYGFCRALLDALEGRDTHEAVRTAALRGLEEDPAQRHGSVADLVAVLEGALLAGRQRSRTLLLERVDRLWLRGVLERSVGETGVAPVELTNAPELVEPPWQEWGARPSAPPAGTSSNAIAHVLRESHDSLLIVGPPGSGKTTLLLSLCRRLWRRSSFDPDAPAPVVLSLSTYHPHQGSSAGTPGQHLARWIVDELVAKYGLPRPGVTRWLDGGEIAILLDGLGETEPAHRHEVIHALNAFRAEHPVPLVVGCRDSEYEAIGERLTFGGAVRIEPLDDAGVRKLVEAHAAPQLEARLAEDDGLRGMLRNPLLLTLYASSEDRESKPSGVPTAPGWGRAYARYVDRAFEGTAPEERRAVEAQLTYLARAMRRLSVSDLWLERLDFSWLGARWERYLGYALGVLAVLGASIGINLLSVASGNPLGSALTFGFAVTVASFAYTRGRIKPVERLRWSWRRALRLLPLTAVCAGTVGLVEAVQVNFWKNIVGAALTGAVLMIAFSLEASNRATRIAPNAGIRRSLDYAFGVSFGFAVPTALAFAFVFEPYLMGPLRQVPEHNADPQVVVPIAVGLFVFSALFLIYGGFTVLMHGVLRFCLLCRSPLGWDLQGALDRAVALGLMRQVGGGYVFLHRTLLDHFADSSR